METLFVSFAVALGLMCMVLGVCCFISVCFECCCNRVKKSRETGMLKFGECSINVLNIIKLFYVLKFFIGLSIASIVATYNKTAFGLYLARIVCFYLIYGILSASYKLYPLTAQSLIQPQLRLSIIGKPKCGAAIPYRVLYFTRYLYKVRV